VYAKIADAATSLQKQGGPCFRGFTETRKSKLMSPD